MSEHAKGSGVTLYTGRFDARGFHRDGKVHSAAHGFDTGTTGAINVTTDCGKTLPRVATTWNVDAWVKLGTDRCARCAAIRLKLDPPTVRRIGADVLTDGYTYREAATVARDELGVAALHLVSADTTLRAYRFRELSPAMVDANPA